MSEAILLLLTGLSAVLGFASIAISQKQHRHQGPPIFATVSPAVLRVKGGLWLALAAVLATLRDGLGFGFLVWATMLTLAGLIVAVGLSRRPRGHDAERGPTRRS